jgi:hypothetical protein
VPGESSEDRIYRLEEEWMNVQGPHSEFGKFIKSHDTLLSQQSDDC